MPWMAALSRCVLVVDDDPEIREVVALMLTDEGYRVREAAGGKEAIASLRAEGPADLVLLDLMMPGMDGRQVSAALRRDPALAGIPIVICSASGEADDLHERLGVDAYVQKPFDLKGLLATVARFSAAPSPPPGAAVR